MTITGTALLEGCTRGDADEVALGSSELGITAIVCRECAREYPIAPLSVCEFCFAPLEIVYDYGCLAQKVDRASIAAGPHSIWRYADLLPVPEANRVSLGAGWTPLRAAPRLAAELGLDRLWIKDDSRNPTNSFKDRVVSVALTVARHFGLRTVSCASTGNLANSVAAHAASAGMESVVFIPHDLEAGKVVGSAVYGGRVIAVEGSYDDVNRLCSELAATKPWGFVNVNLRPYYSEGSKTVAFEIVEQLGWKAPDAIVLPVASGSLLTKVARGLRELHLTGLLDERAATELYGAQGSGCAPVATAFSAGADDFTPVKPATIAKSLAIGNPANGHDVLREVRASGGAVESVTDEEIVTGIELLARTEGIFTETAGGVTIATLEKLARQGTIRRDQEVVAVITGHGLKTTEVLGGATSAVRSAQATVESVDRILDLELEAVR